MAGGSNDASTQQVNAQRYTLFRMRMPYSRIHIEPLKQLDSRAVLGAL